MATSVALRQPVQQAAMHVLPGHGNSGCVQVASPIVEFLFFHKAIRAELERLHQDALAVEKGSEREISALLDRYLFLRTVYKHHSSAEDEVIFPALDVRVKNVAHAYSLEHKVESDLFDQMSELLHTALRDKGNVSSSVRRELVCCTQALQTTLCQHLSKEEEQVFPLLMQHFSFEEQAALVWQFMCSIPVNLMEKFLPWLASSLSHEEREEMVICMRKIVPREELLQQVVFAWLKGGSITTEAKEYLQVDDKLFDWSAMDTMVIGDLAKVWVEGEDAACFLNGSRADGSLDQSRDMLLDRKRGQLDTGQEGGGGKGVSRRFPINELLYWHNAIRKELTEFAEEARRIQLLGDMSAPNLSPFVERLQFLAEVCIFHSAAEDKVVFPAVDRKVKERVSYEMDHAEEERQFDDVRRLLEGVQAAVNSSSTAAQLYGELCVQAELIVKTIQQHLLDEEIQVLPLAREHCTVEEQRVILYQSLRVMPLKLLERVLPWLVAVLSEDEAKDMLRNMRLAAPVTDNALVTLFSGWACKGYPQNISKSGDYRCISSTGVNECPMMKMNSAIPLETEGVLDHAEVPVGNGKVCSNEVGGAHGPEDPLESLDSRPLKRLRGETLEVEQTDVEKGGNLAEGKPSKVCGAGAACCVPGLGCGSIGARASGPSLRSYSLGTVSPLVSSSLGPGLFGWGSALGSFSGPGPKPIDHIFQFHKAIRKDLEYLDVESARLADCDEEFLRQFRGRFQFLWGLYRAHSNAEDDIVFPALEAKEALHNVSHSYTIDHKQEEKLFRDIAQELAELSHLHSHMHCQGPSVSVSCLPPSEAEGRLLIACDGHGEGEVTQQRALAAKLQRMCKSVRVSLDQHVSREELELWPLFDVHFTIEEQDQIVGRIIGTTGAEVLQAMLPWVTTALSEEEQNTMMDTWRQATRNTMFDKWLSAWWKDTPGSAPHSPPTADPAIPPSGTSESLQMVVDYLSKGVSNIDKYQKDGKVACDSKAEEPSVLEGGAKEMEGCVEASSDLGESSGPSHSCRGEDEDHQSHKAVLDTSEQVRDGGEKFKPGWRDIFRMNQKELEAAIRKVSSDSSLDPRRKAYLIQNLMTSRWIAAQQQFSHTQARQAGDGPVDIPGRSRSYQDEEKGIYGCEHYKRNCKLRAVCCGNLFPCRFCHDKVSDHSMDRHATKEMMCLKCLEVQPVAPTCATPSCNGFSMARYFCNICKFFDNDDRDIYHCPFCNLCRVGKGLGIDYFHCMTCNACMSMKLSSHKCRERGLESNCPICHDFLFTSNTPVKALPCDHFMHSACFQAYTCSHYTCPICSKSLGDMAVYFGMLDALLAAEQLPTEYQNRRQDILCNDCGQKGTAPFHWLYHKCSQCGSYNTRTI